MIVPCGIPVINDCPKLCSNKNHIQSFSAHKPKTQESRNNCSDGGGCIAQAKRISSGTIEAAGVDHDDMVPPTNSCTLQRLVLLMYFNQTFGTGTPIDTSKRNWLIDFLKHNFIWLGELPLLGVLYVRVLGLFWLGLLDSLNLWLGNFRFRLGTIGFRSINLGNILFGEVLTDLGNLLHVLEASFLCATP